MVTSMASVKLVNGHSYHHSLCHPHHHPLVRPDSPPEQTMTLDYSLPHRSRSTDYDPGSDSARDLSSPQSHEGSEGRDAQGQAETPTKKNKRKLSEPKKRADFSGKRLCPGDQDQDNDLECRNTSSPKLHDGVREKGHKGKKLVNGHSKHLSSKSHKSSHRDTPSTSSSQGTTENEANRDHSLPSVIPSSLPPHFLHPMFAGVQPTALGYMPGIYFGGQPFPHPSLHASFPAIPLHLQQSYMAAAAAAAAQTSSSSSPLSSLAAAANAVNSSSSSKVGMPEIKTETCVSDSYRSHHPTSHPIVHPPVLPPSMASSSTRPPPSSSSNIQPSSLHLPGSSRTASFINDDDEASSSRAQSPEDLSQGGKMSRKHRKNYKNMTRERRVEANARERTRVHTISAAFDALRRAVPSYSHNQKLSKLAILRIACSYIMALARLADLDYTSASEHIAKPLTFAECVEMCTSTIQTEGRARRRH